MRGCSPTSVWRPKRQSRMMAVGMVGAGGIGVVLWEIIRGFQYAETCAVMLMIIVTVSVIDVISSRVRKVLV